MAGESPETIGATSWLAPVAFNALPGWEADDVLSAFRVFQKSCRQIVDIGPSLREAVPVTRAQRAICTRALVEDVQTKDDARAFFIRYFTPHRIETEAGASRGFLTGYYEPILQASLNKTSDFSEPVWGVPDDLVTVSFNQRSPGSTQITGNILREGILAPFPDRAAIYAGALDGRCPVLAWVSDKIELFMAQVQGSAKLQFQDGTVARLVYAGRNGHPYSSIGRKLIETGAISPDEMSLARLKAWVREAGQAKDEPGRQLLEHNCSFVFFRLDRAAIANEGPIGGQGLPLSALRSIAVDRHIWPYGLPFWIDAELPWERADPTSFARMMIAQDTGSAIIGRARADLYFGTGGHAGRMAGNIRHQANVFVLIPRERGHS